jgi:hypothetical protein
MNVLKQWAIENRLNRILVTCLLGLVLVLNVACSAPKVSQSAPDDIYSQGTQEPRAAMGKLNKSLDENNSKVQAKTRELIDTAKKNGANPNKLEDLSEQARRSAKEFPDQLADRIKSQKDDLVKGTERGVQNLKGNLKEASKEIPNIVKEETDGAIDKVK